MRAVGMQRRIARVTIRSRGSRAASSNSCVMRTAPSASAHSPQKMQQAVDRPSPRATCLVAQRNRARGTHLRRRPGVAPRSRNRTRGRPRKCSETTARRVRIGYRRDAGSQLSFCRILNMSAVRPRIGEIEALIDHRKVGDDVALHRLHQRRPVVHGRVFDLAALQAIVRRRSAPNAGSRRAILPPR